MCYPSHWKLWQLPMGTGDKVGSSKRTSGHLFYPFTVCALRGTDTSRSLWVGKRGGSRWTHWNLSLLLSGGGDGGGGGLFLLVHRGWPFPWHAFEQRHRLGEKKEVWVHRKHVFKSTAKDKKRSLGRRWECCTGYFNFLHFQWGCFPQESNWVKSGVQRAAETTFRTLWLQIP